MYPFKGTIGLKDIFTYQKGKRHVSSAVQRRISINIISLFYFFREKKKGGGVGG